MDSPDQASANKKQNSSRERDTITHDLYHFVKKELQDVREEFGKGIQQTRTSIEMLIAGIHGEIKGIVADIKEIKHMTKGNLRMIEKMSHKAPVSPSFPSKVSTGLDILMQVPRHLRNTYNTVLKAERGVTAQDVATRTGKSRPTESDYLNQLTDKGLISKVRSGKKVLFYYGEKIGENGDGPNNVIINHAVKKPRVAIRISDEEET